MGVTAYLALSNIRELGDYALETSTSLGESAIQDSMAHLNTLGEETIKQIAYHVAKQVELYLRAHPDMTRADMKNNAELREIVVQSVGTTGYTTLIDPVEHVIVIHKFEEQEKDISPLRSVLPSFWELIEKSTSWEQTDGYYDWLEVDGSITKKYASIAPVRSIRGETLTLWATTYIEEFSQPAEETKKDISEALLIASDYINRNVIDIQNVFVVIFTVLVIVVVFLALLLSWVITKPIQELKNGAEAIGKGKLDYRIEVKSRDELGDLATSFNEMVADLKRYMEELEKSAADNIAKERKIQEYLRLYAQKVGQAQEAERKRISRELHDETAQALVVVSRHLDDLASGNPGPTAGEIREEVRKILEGVRKFSQELRPSVLDDLGLIPAVKSLASDLTRYSGISVQSDVTGEQRKLTPDQELMLFRIAQEALTNVRKHSGATRALVRIDFLEHAVRLTVQDNGRGFNTPDRIADLAESGRLGLAGMEERAQLLGGALSIDSEPGKGTSVSVEVPL